MNYKLDFGRYFWPASVRRAVATLFRQYGTDGLTRWERKRLAKRAWRKIRVTELGQIRNIISFPRVSRVTVVSGEKVEFERYDLYDAGVEVHLQDDGRTLKIFPKQE